MPMSDDTTPQPLNWTAIGALYLALAFGLAWMLYWGDYRNAAWLVLLGLGGALTAYGRVQEERGRDERAQRWQMAAGIVYGVFFVWAGMTLIRAWISG